MSIIALVLTVITVVALAIGFVIGMYQWFVAAALMLTIGKYFRPDISPWSIRTGFNAFNGLVVTSWLTLEGRERASRFWVATGKFVLCVFIPFALAYITEVVTGVPLIGR